MPLVTRVTTQVPPAQFGRYLLVGTWNTAFSYGLFAFFTAALGRFVAYPYVAASALANVLSITVSYLGYKRFVFRTKGHYLREWSRCVAVYSVGILLGMAALPLLVAVLRRAAGLNGAAPYAAGALLTGFNAVYSFVGHRKFSFR